jgi:hypothetical protein
MSNWNCQQFRIMNKTGKKKTFFFLSSNQSLFIWQWKSPCNWQLAIWNKCYCPCKSVVGTWWAWGIDNVREKDSLTLSLSLSLHATSCVQ